MPYAREFMVLEFWLASSCFFKILFFFRSVDIVRIIVLMVCMASVSFFFISSKCLGNSFTMYLFNDCGSISCALSPLRVLLVFREDFDDSAMMFHVVLTWISHKNPPKYVPRCKYIDSMHISILVPFRNEPSQNRAAHLQTFLKTLPTTLDAALSPHHTWSIFVGVQCADGRKFSRGRVLNALFFEAVAKQHTDRIVLHDVDLLPDAARAQGYSSAFSGKCLSLNNTGEYAGMAYYIGGICALAPYDFYQINGFPNEIEGWGGEDDALRDRVGISNIVQYTKGSVENLEEGAFAFVRARDDERYKMPKDERRHIRTLWKERDPAVTGLDELLYSATVNTEYSVWVPASYAHQVFLFDLDIYGWSTKISRSANGKPYFFNARTGKSQWERPGRK
jgi:hypothetical protein